MNTHFGLLTTSYVDLDDLIEEHGENKAQVLFEQFRSTPPDGEPDKEFAQSIVDRLPEGMAVLSKVVWGLENPHAESGLEWCQHYYFYFPTIRREGFLEVGGNHYYANIEGDLNGGETWKRQGDAIQYFEETVKRIERKNARA